MAESLNLLVSYWFIFLPLLLLILFLLVVFVRKGYLRNINIFGINLDFNSKSEEKSKNVQNNIEDIYSDGNAKYTSSDLLDYTITFKENALKEIVKLKLTQQSVVNLVQAEFKSHLNYFKYDLRDYPLPVQDGYIVVLDKYEDKLTFCSVKLAKWSELELSSWNNILSLYRRASRHQYRSSADYILRPETISLIAESRKDLLLHVFRHLGVYKGVKDLHDPQSFYMTLQGLANLVETYNMNITKQTKALRNIIDDQEKRKKGNLNDGLLFYASSAITALEDIKKISVDVENNLISQVDADAEIVLSLERSLQYIHKIIMSTML